MYYWENRPGSVSLPKVRIDQTEKTNLLFNPKRQLNTKIKSGGSPRFKLIN